MTHDTTPTRSDDASTDGPSGTAPKTAENADTMGGIDHTHPHRNTTFGSIFGRGPAIAADGGEPAAAADEEAMKDVDHETPTDTDAAEVFDRGLDRDEDRSTVDDPVDEAHDE